MISKEEMYEFASQIAGITDADLEAYKCGGKAKKKAEGGNIFDKVKRAVTPVNKQINSEVQKRKPKKLMDSFPGTSDEATKRQQEQLREERQGHPERFNEDGSRKYNKSQDKPTNENTKPTRLRRK